MIYKSLSARTFKMSLTTLFCLGFSQIIQASEFRWTHFGIRPLAMGNAYVAVADDYNALFYNPAGLARLKEWDGELFNPYGQISTSTIKAFSDLSELVAGASGDTSSVLDFLEKNTGKTHHVSFGITPHLVFPGVGFGAGLDLGATIIVHREISTDLDFGPELIAPVSYAQSFLEDRLSIGGSVKLVARGGVDRNFSIQDISVFSANSKNTDSGETGPQLKDYVDGGYGFGFDAGLLFTPIKTMSPTLGISVTDIGGTSFKKTDIGSSALDIPDLRLPTVNTGVSILPWEANGMFLRASMDVHGINLPFHYSKKFNLGLEWGYGSIIKVQTGLHQGELSAGFEFDTFLFSCRFVSYAEQLGTIAGQDDNLKDRRYALQLKLLI
jgi:hypothetical protein